MEDSLLKLIKGMEVDGPPPSPSKRERKSGRRRRRRSRSTGTRRIRPQTFFTSNQGDPSRANGEYHSKGGMPPPKVRPLQPYPDVDTMEPEEVRKRFQILQREGSGSNRALSLSVREHLEELRESYERVGGSVGKRLRASIDEEIVRETTPAN